MSCPRARLFPGMETQVEYTVSNGKLLPLIWLELSQEVPGRGCLQPDEGFERYTYHANDGEHVEEVEAYRRAFSFLLGFETLTLDALR